MRNFRPLTPPLMRFRKRRFGITLRQQSFCFVVRTCLLDTPDLLISFPTPSQSGSPLTRLAAIIARLPFQSPKSNTVCPFAPLSFDNFFATMGRTDFCKFSHTSQHGLLLLSVSCRPPQLRCVIFPSIYLPHLHNIPSDSYWASV